MSKKIVHSGGLCKTYPSYDKDRRAAQRILTKMNKDLGETKLNMDDLYRPSPPLCKKDREYFAK